MTVVRAPAPEKALVAMFSVLAAPDEVDWTERRYSLVPVVTALADIPSPAPFMALTTDCRLPLPVFTSAAVSEPTVSGPVKVAETVAPSGPLRVTAWPGEKLVRSLATPSTVTIPSVPLAVALGVAENPSAAAASPPVICSEVPLPWAAVLTTRSPEELTDAVSWPPEAVCTAAARVAGV